MKNRRFKKGAFQHIYQRSVDCGTIFYSRIDRLVLYSIASIQSSKYHVDVVQMTIMFNHVHWLIAPVNLMAQSRFIGSVTSKFTTAYNKSSGRHGPLFSGPYGSASKLSLKDKMSIVNYLGNNPVVKRLVNRGVDDRWTFLAYADGNRYPFSEKLRLAAASRKMRRAVSMVKAVRNAGRPLEYQTLWNMFSGLSKAEMEQLTDFIISEYAFIRHDRIVNLFGNMDKMILAMDANSGSEYDIDENDGPESHIAYVEMIRTANRMGWNRMRRAFTDASESECRNLILAFARGTSANQMQMAHFLHMNLEEVRRIRRASNGQGSNFRGR